VVKFDVLVGGHVHVLLQHRRTASGNTIFRMQVKSP
jgi:hypothetical protein